MADQDLLKTIRQVRGRWKLALMLRGAAIFVAALLLLLAVSAIGFAQFGFVPEIVLALRWLVGLSALASFAWLVAMPALRHVDDARVALYIEEHEPGLEAALISAIEAPAGDSALARAMIERAAAQCRSLEFGTRIEQQRLRRNASVLAAASITALLIVGAGPSSLRHTARALLLPTPAAEAAAVVSIAVQPGNDTIARGADIAIAAQLIAFGAEQAFVVLKDTHGEQRRWSMSAAQQKGAFEALLFDITTGTEYYIEANNVRSPTYRIDVVDAPHVSSITLEYTYPAYTGMAPRRVVDAGDIVVPKGTLVRVIAAVSTPVREGRVQLADARAIRMQPTPAGELQATMRVLTDGLYHIELPGIDGRLASASAQYAITVIEDAPPSVRIEKPGRDVRVNAIDEVFVAASAQDDYGVARLELVYSVNGAAQQTQNLAAPGRNATETAGGHTFFLEELSLQPGDFVSYFVRAADNNAVDGARTSTSDIYFIQIKPFSREYRAAEQAGMPGNGGGEEDAGALSEQQRRIIAATFNISRDRGTYTEQGFREALTTIELSQEKLREQVNTLLQRMNQRGVVGMDSIFEQIARLLPQATREMEAAQAQLQRRQPDGALAPEQRALQQLLRAEALYREVQVQMQQQQQPGGGGSSPQSEDLADLFDLERDQLRNQYEQVQRSRAEQAQRQVDETLERLRELAQRQQQEAERQQQARGGQSQQGAGGTGGAQRRLADEAEDAARQLERLSRENSNPELAEAARRLRDAAESMRRASAERAGRSLAEANDAREQLEEARRRLQQSQQQGLRERVEAARARAQELRAQQDNIARESEAARGAPTNEQARRLNEQRNQLGSGVADLENRLDRLSAEARDGNGTREAARQLQAAADAIRDSRLRERIRAAQGSAQSRSREFNRAQDEQIARDLDRVAQQLGQASAASGEQSAESQGRAAAEQARGMARGIESMRDRARAAQGSEATSSTPQGASRSGDNGSAERQLRAEARARAGELQELQRQLGQQGMQSADLESALQALRALQSSGPYNDPEEIQRLLARVARGLQDFEFDVRQALGDKEREKLFLSAQGQVPARFRKAVEEYYRSLAQRRQ